MAADFDDMPFGQLLLKQAECNKIIFVQILPDIDFSHFIRYMIRCSRLINLFEINRQVFFFLLNSFLDKIPILHPDGSLFG